MRTSLTIVAIALLCACGNEPPKAAVAEVELRTAHDAYDKALIDGDPAALGQIMTDDFQIVDDDGGVHGKRDQIEFMTRQVDLLDGRTDGLAITMLAPDSALVTGRFTSRFRYQGKVDDATERFTSLWVRQSGKWQVRHEHVSTLPKPKLS
jgi:ketosteroid isomerase-like protein